MKRIIICLLVLSSCTIPPEEKYAPDLPEIMKGATKFYSSNKIADSINIHILVDDIDIGKLWYSPYAPECNIARFAYIKLSEGGPHVAKFFDPNNIGNYFTITFTVPRNYDNCFWVDVNQK